MTNFNRISSIDIMRGLLIFLMLVFNYPGSETLPSWLQNDPFIFGKTCWIFPGFLFLTGLSIPFSFNVRISRGDQQPQVMRHILTRFISLLIIGLLLINILRIDSEITGMSRSLWSVAALAGIFLVWNDYADGDSNFFTITGLKLFGMAVLTFLVFKFRSGQAENNGSLIIGWWGYPGLIGWGYLTSALIYLFFRRSAFMLIILSLAFLALNIVSDLQILVLPELVGSIFGPVINGYVPFVVLTGMLTGIVIRSFSSSEYGKVIGILAGIMIVLSASGIVILLTGILPVTGTTALTLISSGACILLYLIIYLIADIRNMTAWSSFMRPAGENSLTTYIAPLLVYYLVVASGLPVFFFQDPEKPVLMIAGSLVWAFLMVQLTVLLVRLNIRLKL
jgi:hypothetical protein